MSYVSLYRKFRPDTFREVKGQDHIVTTLQNQLQYDRVGHAYLFCGTRGTGKTTVAKILAKAVNCENPQEGNPCGECESCRRLAMGAAMNVMEIDAASNNGVDNIRDINAAVQYPPSEGNYIVYIIDEVHMLSQGAFNALLKTLEEPPSYVIFILATTEDMKVPITIKSRCQRYDFHRISVETISARLAGLMEREGIQAEPEALRYIAQAADGSMRDALSILEECVSASLGEDLTFDRVLGQIGAVEVDVYLRLLDALTREKAEDMLDIVNDAVWKGKDLTKFTDDMVWFVRNVLFLKMAPGAGAGLDLTGETEEKLTEAGKAVSEETLVRYLRILQELSVSVRNSTIRRITLEMGLIRMMKPESDRDYEAVIGRLEKLEAGNASGRSDAPENSSGNASSSGQALPAGEELNRLLDREVEKRVNELLRSAEEGGAIQLKRKRTPEEMDQLARKNLAAHYPPAKMEEILQLAKEFKNKVIPQLSLPARDYLKEVAIMPWDENENAPGLKLVVYGEPLETNPGSYFSRPEHLQKLEEDISRIMNKQVPLHLEVRRRIRGRDEDDETMALNVIRFEEKVIED